MTKFLYLSDTHLGKEPNGFQQQQSYPERLTEILAALKREVEARGDLDFVLHGGDMIHSTSNEDILRASELFDWDLPVYLCLGNHDLTVPDAKDRWMKSAPQLFIDASPVYSIETPDCTIHVTPNHWGDEDYIWKVSQDARFSGEQMEALSRGLSMRPDLPHFISTHSPAFGLPVAQSGLKEPIHVPDEAFTQQITSLADQYPNLRGVLGAHSHLNMRVRYKEVECITVSSIIEAPFEYKIFELGAGSMQMTTHRLGDGLPFAYLYDEARSFVQGREQDRMFVQEWP